MGQPQAVDRSLEKLPSTSAGVEQDPLRIWPGQGQHQPGHPSAAAEIDGATRGNRAQVAKGPTVIQVGQDRPGSEEAERPGFRKQTHERVVEGVPAA
jgi:hypothetical protein